MNDVIGYGTIILALLFANLPWFSNRFLIMGFKLPEKGAVRWRLLQWFIYLIIMAFIALLLEYQVTGTRYAQDWEFYASNGCLFVIFAFPGYLFRMYQNANKNRV